MEQFTRKNILLTGGSGFIGRNIQESFLSDKYHILAPSSKELNLSDEKSVDAYFESHRVNIVIHSAVKPGHRNAKDFSDLFYTNTRMFFNLERHREKYEKMLVIGSGAIYDNRCYHAKMREKEWDAHIPADEHGYCKYVCEKVIEKSSNIYDLRVFGIFGKYEDYTIRFISNAICKAVFGLPITIRQNRKFDYLFVDDLMSIIGWFIENKPKYSSYNITPDTSISLYDLAVLVKELSGADVPILVSETDMGLEYSGDNFRLRSEMCPLVFTPLKDSIHSLIEWYRIQKEVIDVNLLLTDK